MRWENNEKRQCSLLESGEMNWESEDAPGEPLESSDPSSIGPYTLRRVLGRGGMGVVYLAENSSAHTGDASVVPVAVKVIRPEYASNRNYLLRFRKEVDVAKLVDSPNVARLVDTGVDGTFRYLVTEYVPGPTLEQEVRARGPLNNTRLTELVLLLSNAIVAFEKVGVVHRDLKPANVILSPDGPKIIDFGVARVMDSTTVTVAGAIVGSPAWMAPEQLLGQACSSAVDVHCWGVTITYAATGRSLYDGDSAESRMWQVVHKTPDLSGLDPWLRPVVSVALSKTAAARPSPAALVRLVSSALAIAPRSSPSEETTARLSSNGVLCALQPSRKDPAGWGDTKKGISAWPDGKDVSFGSSWGRLEKDPPVASLPGSAFAEGRAFVTGVSAPTSGQGSRGEEGRDPTDTWLDVDTGFFHEVEETKDKRWPMLVGVLVGMVAAILLILGVSFGLLRSDTSVKEKGNKADGDSFSEIFPTTTTSTTTTTTTTLPANVVEAPGERMKSYLDNFRCDILRDFGLEKIFSDGDCAEPLPVPDESNR